MSSLLLEQSLWRGLLRLGDLAELIVVAIVEVAVALVARVEALLGVGSGVGGQLGVVQGGRLPVRPLLLLLVGVVDPGLVGHRDSSLVLGSRQVFIPARGFGGLVERIKRRKRHYEAHSRQPLKTDKLICWTHVVDCPTMLDFHLYSMTRLNEHSARTHALLI